MKKSGLADSPFFAPQVKTAVTPPSPANPIVEKTESPLPESTTVNVPVQIETPKKISNPKGKIDKSKTGDTMTPRNHDTTQP